jgi:single-strand selective monofunctional uracil DNA glycosylase
MTHAQALLDAASRLSRRLARLHFEAPVTHVYNPLVYARAPYASYLRHYAEGNKRVLFLGMNPGPFGMAQTGVPFGEVNMVRDWLGIEEPVAKPRLEHPKRPVRGFACDRSEVSGARLWGLWRELYGSPQRFFSWAFVANYCPLVFMEKSGRNLTPDKLRSPERLAVQRACDEHLLRVIEVLRPRYLVGVGKFAEGRARAAALALGHDQVSLQLGCIPHPSPASPAANRNWRAATLAALDEQGIALGKRSAAT